MSEIILDSSVSSREYKGKEWTWEEEVDVLVWLSNVVVFNSSTCCDDVILTIGDIVIFVCISSFIVEESFGLYSLNILLIVVNVV